MKKEYTPIAMRCNQEQFDRIKPKLEKNGIVIKMMTDFCCTSVKYYLINDFNAKLGTVTNVSNPSRKGRTQYETWNEQIFLEACGIKTEKPMKLSKEFIKANADKTLKEVFPKLFTLEVNKWYKCIEKGFESLAFITDLKKNEAYGVTYYGVNDKNIWVDNANRGWSFGDVKNWIEATNEEVFEALKAELIRLGVKEDACFVCLESKKPIICFGSEPGLADFAKSYNNEYIYFGGVKVYENGKFSKRVETITKEEAEKLLNKKIV